MSDTGSDDHIKPQVTKPKASDVPLNCAAEDLREILSHITKQIADADRRHSTALTDMQSRLIGLGGKAETVRSRVPEEYAPAFQRIEDGVALLADRIAEAGRDRKYSRISGSTPGADEIPAAASSYSLAHDGYIPASVQEIVAPRPTVAPAVATVTGSTDDIRSSEPVAAADLPAEAAPSVAAAELVPVEAPVADDVAVVPVALAPAPPAALAAAVALSALSSTSPLAMAAIAQSESRTLAPLSTATGKTEPKPFAAHILNLQMAAKATFAAAILSQPKPAVEAIDSDSPWDAESVAALTQIYHPTAPVEAVPAPSAAIHASPDAAALDSASANSASDDKVADDKAAREDERCWLEARFADIASRVDMLQSASVDQVKARASLAEERGWLDARFAELMSRVQSIQTSAAQVATARSGLDAERQWLEQRFADLNTRMQKLTTITTTATNSLVDNAPDTAMAQVHEQIRISLEAERQWIDERFADLTKRVDALKTAAPDPLADQAKIDAERDWLEARFADMTTRVEQLQAIGADTASARANLDAERQWLEGRFADITKHVTDQVSSQMQSFAQTQSPPTSDADKDAEHDWFDSKFADLADRVQQSLDDMRQDNSLVSLDQRFDQFEQRLGDALDDMATRADANGLKQVEAHIGELAQQIEQAQVQLGRLEQIEGHLTELMSRVSDERLGELMGQAGPSPADIENVASVVADRIALRLPQPSAHPTSADLTGFEDLRGLIQNFVEDQRQGEEHTASMLDTMQQAMIRVLDRMDALESGHTATPKLAFNTVPNPQSMQPAQPMPAAAMPHNIAGERQPAQAPMPPVAAAEPVVAGPSGASTMAATRRNLQRQAEAAAAAAEVKSAKPFSPGPKAAAAPTEGSGSAKREDFIAGARRAARQPSATNPTLNVADDDKEDAPASRFSGIAKALSNGNAKDGGKLRPTLMVAAVTGLVAVGLLAATVTVYKNQGPVVSPRANAAVIDLRSGGLEPQSEKVDLGKLSDRPNLDKLSNDVGQTSVTDGLRQDVQLIADGQTADQIADSANALNGNTIEGQIQDAPIIRTPGTTDQVLNNQGLPLGISVVQTNSLPNDQSMLRARQQQQMADMSSKLGQSQAQAQSVVQAQYQARNAQSAPQAAIQNAIPTALTQPASKAAEAELAGPAGTSTAMVELPPAFVGPMSLRVAAAKGDPSAAFEVAARLAEGRGVNQDFNLAMTWYQRSAQKGFAQAQYRLGTLYERGIGVTADLPRAKIWYARAAEQGNVKSMHNLAVLSAGRDAEATDYAVASKWFIGAAQHGLADSQFNLGVLYESGLGVARDPKQAYLWLSLAARSGDKEAAKRRDVVRASLTQQDARDVEALVVNWKAQPMDRASNDALAGGEAWKARQNLRQPG